LVILPTKDPFSRSSEVIFDGKFKDTHYVHVSRVRVISSGKLPVLTKNLSGHRIFVIWMDHFKNTLTNQVFLNNNMVTRKKMY